MSAQEHPNELNWAKYFSGEVRWLAGWRFRRHLMGCAPCRQLETEMVAERASFDASPRRSEEVALLQGRLGDSPTVAGPRALPRVRWALAGGMVAVALVVALVRSSQPSLLEKGGDVFTMYVERPSGVAPLGSRCAAGDRIIARYRTARGYLLVLERDARGVVQVLHPRDGPASARLSNAEGTMPTSWILDAVPGQECFAAFFSEESVKAVLAIQAFAASSSAPKLSGSTVRVQCCEKGPSR